MKDLRYIKTEQSIRQALVSLLGRKSFESVTVQNILDEALINRKTFYCHYADKYELAKVMSDELYEELTRFSSLRHGKIERSVTFFSQIEQIYDRLYEEKDRLLALWNVSPEAPSINDRMLSFYSSEYIASFHEKNGSESVSGDYDLDLQSHMFATLQVGTLLYILRSGRRYTGKQMYHEFLKFYETVVKGY